jgi:hypothetical protein
VEEGQRFLGISISRVNKKAKIARVKVIASHQRKCFKAAAVWKTLDSNLPPKMRMRLFFSFLSGQRLE